MHTWGVFFYHSSMAKKAFDKKPTTYTQQLHLIKCRGLAVPDEAKAIRYLKQISYYRLSAYFIPYQSAKDQFNRGVTFDQILNTYRFDRELRLLVFDCIERIEVAIRSQMNHVLVHRYASSHWQDLPNVFKVPYLNRQGETVSPFENFQRIIRKSCSSKNPEVFIKHYLKNYSTPTNPPSWMCVELLTIGELSRLYLDLTHNSDKQAIADFFGLHHTVFTSWLHTLTYVRNLCAHHSRLWNRELAIKPDALQKPKHRWVKKPFEINQRCFYLLCILKYLLVAANPNNHLKLKLDRLFQKYPTVPVKFMGIPSDTNGVLLDWSKEDLWM